MRKHICGLQARTGPKQITVADHRSSKDCTTLFKDAIYCVSIFVWDELRLVVVFRFLVHE